MNYYETDFSLCVLPSEKTKESQYEAFQSIFAKIMGGDPYILLCTKAHIRLLESNTAPRSKGYPLIFYKIPSSGSTHYKAVIDSKVIDPYKLYQASGTQGFCQMFAYFLATGDADDFKKVDQIKRIDQTNFDNLCYNTAVCLIKSLLLINTDIFVSFKEEFEKIMISKDHTADALYYGIKQGTTVEKYLTEFQTLNSSLRAVKFYIYDQPLKGYTKNNKGAIWGYIQTGVWPAAVVKKTPIKKKSLKRLK